MHESESRRCKGSWWLVSFIALLPIHFLSSLIFVLYSSINNLRQLLRTDLTFVLFLLSDQIKSVVILFT